MTRHFAALALSAIVVCPASAGDGQATSPDLGSRLVGTWRGEGMVTGRASRIVMTWERIMNGAFLHLSFRNEMAASASRPAEVFEGRGYYRFAAATTTAPAGQRGGTGTWIDSRGLILPLMFATTADALTSDWGTEGTERGRTTYRFTGPDALEVIDLVRTADVTYREFGRSVLGRQ
jgi:hypothetical protein